MVWRRVGAGGRRPGTVQAACGGGLAGVSQYVNHEEPFWTRDLARLSQGRYSADIVPFDRAGVPGTEMLRLLQLGVVPLGTVLMSQLAQSHPHYALLDLPALNADLSHLRSHLSAYRPTWSAACASSMGWSCWRCTSTRRRCFSASNP